MIYEFSQYHNRSGFSFFSAFVQHLLKKKTAHHEQALVKVQISVVEAAAMLDWLGGHHPSLLLFLAAPCQSWTPETTVKRHADSVEALR